MRCVGWRVLPCPEHDARALGLTQMLRFVWESGHQSYGAALCVFLADVGLMVEASSRVIRLPLCQS